MGRRAGLPTCGRLTAPLERGANHPVRTLLICLLFLPRLALADDVPDDFLRAFNQVAREAEAALKQGGPDAAIARFEQALLGDLAGYGRIHLRLGQLRQQQTRYALAARHFEACMGDERVDAVDRELICQEGQRAVTAPVILEGLPPNGRVVVVEPAAFAGPLTSEQRVPLGPLTVVVEVPDHHPRASDLQVTGQLRWTVVVGDPLSTPLPPGLQLGHAAPPAAADTALRWPAWVAAGTGIALVGTGLWLGLDNQKTLDNIRDRQRNGQCPGICARDLQDAEGTAQLADGLWIGGAVVTAGAVALWYLLDGDAP